MKKLLNAGDLKHRVAIQEQLEEQDSDTGDIVYEWATVNDERGDWSSLAAAIEPMSAREFIAAQSFQSEVSTRIVIRYRAGVKSKMRVLHGADVYDIKGPPLRDLDSGREYMTLMCAIGVTDG